MFLQGLADLSRAQRWRFTHALLGFACVAAAALIGRTVGDSLFLTHFESEHLTYMYPVSATVAGVLAYGYGLLACRLPLVRLISLAVGFLLIVLLALRGPFHVQDGSACLGPAAGKGQERGGEKSGRPLSIMPYLLMYPQWL